MCTVWDTLTKNAKAMKKKAFPPGMGGGPNRRKNHFTPSEDFRPNEDLPTDFVDQILDDVRVQYNISVMLEKDILPQIYLVHRWNWWVVLKAMLELGFFRTHFNRLHKQENVTDVNFARCMYCFLPVQFICDNLKGSTSYTKSGMPFNNVIRNITKNIYDHRISENDLAKTVYARHIQEVMVVLGSYDLTFL